MRRGLPLAALVIWACGTHAARPTPTVAPPPAASTAAAERGASLFTTRGCAACHSIGSGRRVGPDLAGLTERREPDWILAMITRPDSMLRHDAIAAELAADYGTAMPRLGIESGEAGALLAYIRTVPSIDADSAATRGWRCPGCGRGHHARWRAMSGG